MNAFARAGVRVALLVAVGAIGACTGTPEQPAAPVVTADPIDAATTGSIGGTIMLTGAPPAAAPINMASDPYCESQGQAVADEYRTGSGGALGNVFVYVKDGLGQRTFAVPSTPAVLDQKGCQYAPHVLGVQVGQTLEIRSSDSTLHNMHALPEHNREFNKAIQLPGLNHTHTFSTAEVMIPFKCDVHRWMRAYVGVLDHPFFAVTGADGSFRLAGLPPGTYTLEAWHEKLGRQTQSVTIGAKEAKDISFTFTI